MRSKCSLLSHRNMDLFPEIFFAKSMFCAGCKRSYVYTHEDGSWPKTIVLAAVTFIGNAKELAVSGPFYDSP